MKQTDHTVVSPTDVAADFWAVATSILESMLLSREGDRRESLYIRQGKGWFQLASLGHEAMAAVAPHLTGSDFIFPSYRDRALALARGMEFETLARDFFASANSSSAGRNLPGHLSSRPLNLFSITSPVAAQALPAVGAALGIKRSKQRDVVLCTIGDASTRQGEFYEAVCYAIQEQLPVVFIVEDNGYGISTPTLNMTPLSLGALAPHLIKLCNGRSAEEVFQSSRDAIRNARLGKGPNILWCKFDRLASHSNGDDHRRYRDAAELEAIAALDPVEILAQRLIACEIMTRSEWDQMQNKATERVRATYQRIQQEALPHPDGVQDHLYGQPSISHPAIVQSSISHENDPNPRVNTLRQSTNDVLRAGLATDPRVLLFGQDIEDPKGGVFGITRGLSGAFPGRVINAPLAEATMIGVAVGLAATGWRPVVELQFIDFVGPAFNQLVSQVTNLRWRTLGAWSCPMVIYAPYGAYFPGGGMWHSQSNEAWFAHMPGLRVAAPSTPSDAFGLFWAALHDDDPTLILLPKHLLGVQMADDVPLLPDGIRFGQARKVCAGSDVTVVAWGNCIEIAMAAATQVTRTRGISVEVLDLRTLVPCDWEAIAGSIKKTRRLVVVQEDKRTGGFGQAIIAEMLTRQDTFSALLTSPRLVACPDVHIPYCPDLAASILPDEEKVVEAIYATLESIRQPS